MNLCPMCRANHEKNHTLIDYELKNYLCDKHGEKFISHCMKCNKNLCDLCTVEHKSHGLIYHADIIKDINYDEHLDNLKKNIEEIKNQINELVKKLNDFIANLDIYYEISEKIINCNINLKSQNYELVINKNHLNENNKKLNEVLNNIISQNQVHLKVQNIIQIYEQMYPKSVIDIKYKIEKDEKIIKILGDTFINENKNKFKILVEDKPYELNSSVDIDKIKTKG